MHGKHCQKSCFFLPIVSHITFSRHSKKRFDCIYHAKYEHYIAEWIPRKSWWHMRNILDWFFVNFIFYVKFLSMVKHTTLSNTHTYSNSPCVTASRQAKPTNGLILWWIIFAWFNVTYNSFRKLLNSGHLFFQLWKIHSRSCTYRTWYGIKPHSTPSNFACEWHSFSKKFPLE